MEPDPRPRRPISFNHRRALPSAPTLHTQTTQSNPQKRPSTEPEPSSSAASTPRPRKKAKRGGDFRGQVKRSTTVYEACLGHIGTEGQLSTAHPTPIGPEEILYSRKSIQKRFKSFETFERAYYDAQATATDPHTGRSSRLPDSDLLFAIWEYARQFYASMEDEKCGNEGECWGSLDGSALIAVGVLIEEMCKAEVGATGGLAMMEGARADLGMARSGERLTIVGGRQVRDVITRKVVRSRSGSRERGSRSGMEDSETDYQGAVMSGDERR